VEINTGAKPEAIEAGASAN